MNKVYFLFLFVVVFSPKLSTAEILIVAEKNNNLVEMLEKNKRSISRFDDYQDAFSQAKTGDILMLLDASGKEIEAISLQLLKEVLQKGVRIYLEAPYFVPELSNGERSKIILERGVINTSKIDGVDSLSIISLNDHDFISYENQSSLIRLAKVAGFDKADYGFEGTLHYPLLFEYDQLLIASSKLSDLFTARLGPTDYWLKVWDFILDNLGFEENVDWSKAPKTVRPSFEKNKQLDQNDYTKAIERGSEWYINSRLLVHPDWLSQVEKNTKKNGEGVIYPAIEEKAPIGDGSFGILEGHASYINKDGSQPVRWWLRADCQAETAFALSSAARYVGKKEYTDIATNLMNYLYKSSNMRAGERNDPKSPSFGLVGWATTDPDAYYGDDNAKVLLASIGASTNLNKSDWDSYIIEGILGNFRTAGKNGFRGPWFRDAKMQETTWQALGDREITNVHPHYESWLWAVYLWLYDKTEYEPLKDKAKQAITITMQNYPEWKWTNGIQQEYARMILPLAWLVRVEDTAEHREWLDLIVNKLLEDLDESGAIMEKLGPKGLGRYDKIASNAEYGTKEAPLISTYGDQVADLLYTLNYSVFSLQEAAAATSNTEYYAALNKITDFLVKAQVRAEDHPELDGAWFRAFDFGRWEYWASNADSGWGPWGTQTGWTQSWILNGIIFNQKSQNFWDYTEGKYKSKSFKKLTRTKIKTMLK